MKSIIKSIFQKGGNKELILHPNINHDKKYIFIHIPKNAGTSIYKSLGMTEPNHSQYIDYSNALGSEINQYFTFCIARNPFDRFVSLYNYAKMEESYYHSSINPEKTIYGKHMDYDLLKNKNLNQCAQHLINGDLRHDTVKNHWQPQSNWILNKEGENKVKYIGKLEDLDLQIMNLNNILNINIENKKLNTSVRKDKSYREIIDNKTREILEYFYKNDLDLFNYHF